jgi:hypothetical protein
MRYNQEFNQKLKEAPKTSMIILNGERNASKDIVKFIQMKLEKMTPLTLNEIA